ncbi:hypothetical protein FACS1894132_04060 [Clostridia bacterium]|nr:hypothetical protein FACS1894132_04060 [Clostridia bacterium]
MAEKGKKLLIIIAAWLLLGGILNFILLLIDGESVYIAFSSFSRTIYFVLGLFIIPDHRIRYVLAVLLMIYFLGNLILLGFGFNILDAIINFIIAVNLFTNKNIKAYYDNKFNKKNENEENKDEE